MVILILPAYLLCGRLWSLSHQNPFLSLSRHHDCHQITFQATLLGQFDEIIPCHVKDSNSLQLRLTYVSHPSLSFCSDFISQFKVFVCERKPYDSGRFTGSDTYRIHGFGSLIQLTMYFWYLPSAEEMSSGQSFTSSRTSWTLALWHAVSQSLLMKLFSFEQRFSFCKTMSVWYSFSAFVLFVRVCPQRKHPTGQRVRDWNGVWCVSCTITTSWLSVGFDSKQRTACSLWVCWNWGTNTCTAHIVKEAELNTSLSRSIVEIR